MDMKQQKFDLLHLSIKEILNEIIKRIFPNFTRPLHSQYNFKNEKFMEDVFCRYLLLFVLPLSWFKTYPHVDAKQRKTKK
jgi:hypothetical protein